MADIPEDIKPADPGASCSLMIGQLSVIIAIGYLWGWPWGLLSCGALICAEAWINGFLRSRSNG